MLIKLVVLLAALALPPSPILVADRAADVATAPAPPAHAVTAAATSSAASAETSAQTPAQTSAAASPDAQAEAAVEIDPLVREALLEHETRRTRECVLGARIPPAPGLERFDGLYSEWVQRCQGIALLEPVARDACAPVTANNPVCGVLHDAEPGARLVTAGVGLRLVPDLEALTALRDLEPWQPFAAFDGDPHTGLRGGATATRFRQGNLSVHAALGLELQPPGAAPGDAARQLAAIGVDWTPQDAWLWPGIQFVTNIERPVSGETGYALVIEGLDLRIPVWGDAAGGRLEGRATLTPESIIALRLGAQLTLAALDGPDDAPRVAWRLAFPTEGLDEAVEAMIRYYDDGIEDDLARTRRAQ